ncbi:hypothetical protein BaRGS_00031793 [Batillaria attramentaria]|uniref:VPS37 C-terminal domain-containing protein n=1 Tax=Batillaria attramentaria TaxID=370345 RepID=A0ABD0JQC5_9CAEN
MHKLFGGGKAKAPSATNLQIQKTKQIESLRKVSAIEILRDVEYRVVFRVGASNFTLVIGLSAQFPQEKPVVSINPPVTHPWVDPNTQWVTGCPSLNNFSMHSDLGQAIQTIIDDPPPAGAPPSYSVGPPPGYPPPLYANQGMESYPAGPPPIPPRNPPSGAVSTQDGLGSETSTPDFTMPDIMKAFPQLKEKKLFELQELIENDDQLLEMVQGLPELKSFAERREALSEKCVSLAQSNLSQKPKIEELKNDIVEKMAVLDGLRQSFEANCEQHLALSEQFRPSNIQTNLKVAILQAEEESENIVEQFLSRKMDVEDFTQQFLQKRKLCHMRKAKEEKLSHIIMSQGDRY